VTASIATAVPSTTFVDCQCLRRLSVRIPLKRLIHLTKSHLRYQPSCGCWRPGLTCACLAIEDTLEPNSKFFLQVTNSTAIMAPTTSQRTWEVENNILTVDTSTNALYTLPSHEAYQALQNSKPWKSNPDYFTHVRISALALLKMTIHARSGGSIEIMGLMTGYVSGTSIIITDAFRLPVEGTETRVNAQADADEYMVNFGELSRNGGGQQENPIGWYHSHPGYGCWLSGIDVATERLQQTVNDPFVAVVIDPDRTVSAGKVEIGAFRTYKEGERSSKIVEDDGFQAIPSNKVEDFGAHANAYYSLEVTHFKSSLDSHLLDLLWNKYWTSTLSQSPLYTNRDYANKQIYDHSHKLHLAASKYRAGVPTMSARPRELVASADPNINFKVKPGQEMEQLVRSGDRIAGEETAGLWAEQVKKKLFLGVVQEAKQKMTQEQHAAVNAQPA
jgi:COP9 signalosome complex subunit 5